MPAFQVIGKRARRDRSAGSGVGCHPLYCTLNPTTTED
jgi:hypothetical protein